MTENRKVAVIVLAAGKGTRMKSDLPKVMMPLCGKPMIRHIIETLEAMHVDKIVPVVSADGAFSFAASLRLQPRSAKFPARKAQPLKATIFRRLP